MCSEYEIRLLSKQQHLTASSVTDFLNYSRRSSAREMLQPRATPEGQLGKTALHTESKNVTQWH